MSKVTACFVQVERVAASDISIQDFTATYVSRCVPVILTGAMESWSAYGTWNTGFFRDSFGDTEASEGPMGHASSCTPLQ